MKKVWKCIGIAALILAILAEGILSYIQFKGVREPYKAVDTAKSETVNKFIKTDGVTGISAHRSGGGIYPEDTMMALKGLVNAIESKEYETEFVEFDLWLTKDEKLILLHDDTLDRTTDAAETWGNASAKPADYTLAEIDTLNFGENFVNEAGEMPYRGLRGKEIPDDLSACTLDEALDFLTKTKDFGYIIEIKDGGERGIRALDILVETAKRYDIVDDLLVGSFQENVMAYMDEAYPELMRIASGTEATAFWLDYMLNRPVDPDKYSFDILNVIPYFSPGYLDIESGIAPFHGIVNMSTQGYVNRAHQANLAVFYWTIDDEDMARKLNKIHADCIITDYPDMATRIRKEMKQ